VEGGDDGGRRGAHSPSERQSLSSAGKLLTQLHDTGTRARGLDDGMAFARHGQAALGLFARVVPRTDGGAIVVGPEAATRLSAIRTIIATAKSQRQISDPFPVENKARPHLELSATSVTDPGSRSLSSSLEMGARMDSWEGVFTATKPTVESF
jgi:hypothetical protein